MGIIANIGVIITVTLFTLSIIANFFMYQQIKDNNASSTIKEVSLFNWLQSEVKTKRTYSNLSLSLIEQRDLIDFKYKTLKKAIFMYLHGNMSKEDLKSKLK